MRLDLNRGWSFTGNCDDAFLRGESVSGLTTVDLPHTCCETPYDYFDESMYQMVCGYRRILSIPSAWKGKRVILQIGAAGPLRVQRDPAEQQEESDDKQFTSHL